MVTPHNNSGGVCPQKQIAEQVPCSHTAWSHTQPRKSCCLCRELLPCCKEEAGASGKLPPRWSCTLLLLFCLLGTHAGFLQIQPPSEFKAGCLNTVPGCFPFTHESMWDSGPWQNASDPPAGHSSGGKDGYWHIFLLVLLSLASLWELMLQDPGCIVV